jgi:hypothetical protein
MRRLVYYRNLELGRTVEWKEVGSRHSEEDTMEIVFVMMICAAVAAPFVAFAWAIKRQHCPHCGATIEPDAELVRMFTGR